MKPVCIVIILLLSLKSLGRGENDVRLLQSFSCSPVSSSTVCVSKEQLIAINAQDDFFPGCDPSQPAKGATGGGFFCTQAFADTLNEMLQMYGFCSDKEKISRFLAQMAFSSGYFTALGPSGGGGAGYLNMIPANFERNVDDMDLVSCRAAGAPSIRSEYDAFVDKVDFFKDENYAWLSVAAWYLKSNWAIPGCDGKNLFEESFEQQTFCVLAANQDRNQALLRTMKVVCPGGCSVASPPTSPATNTPVQDLTPIYASLGASAACFVAFIGYMRTRVVPREMESPIRDVRSASEIVNPRRVERL